MNVKVSYGKCSMTCLGIEINCPLCGVLVKSGTAHECERAEAPKKLKKQKVTPAAIGSGDTTETDAARNTERNSC